MTATWKLSLVPVRKRTNKQPAASTAFPYNLASHAYFAADQPDQPAFYFCPAHHGQTVACCTSSDQSPPSPESHKKGCRFVQGRISFAMAALSVVIFYISPTTRWRRTTVCRPCWLHCSSLKPLSVTYLGRKLLSRIYSKLSQSTLTITLWAPCKSIRRGPRETCPVTNYFA